MTVTSGVFNYDFGKFVPERAQVHTKIKMREMNWIFDIDHR